MKLIVKKQFLVYLVRNFNNLFCIQIVTRDFPKLDTAQKNQKQNNFFVN